MRKFIVKHFVLSYRFKIFGKYFWAPRASRVIMPLMLLNGLISLINPVYPDPTWYSVLALIPLLLSLYLGFFYFEKHPVKWEELDTEQKYQFGQAVQWKISNKIKLTDEQLEEWKQISENYN